MESLSRLQSWYKTQCDGDWEHSYGVKIETLDNPGWALTVGLADTPLEGLQFSFSEEKSNLDWVEIIALDNQFIGYGDPDKLDFLIHFFLDEIAAKYSEKNFEYELLLPLDGAPIPVWTEARGILVSENKFVITSIENPNSKTMLCETLENIDSWINDFETFKLLDKIGDTIDIELVSTFQGIRLGKKTCN